MESQQATLFHCFGEELTDSFRKLIKSVPIFVNNMYKVYTKVLVSNCYWPIST